MALGSQVATLMCNHCKHVAVALTSAFASLQTLAGLSCFHKALTSTTPRLTVLIFQTMLVQLTYKHHQKNETIPYKTISPARLHSVDCQGLCGISAVKALSVFPVLIIAQRTDWWVIFFFDLCWFAGELEVLKTVNQRLGRLGIESLRKRAGVWLTQAEQLVNTQRRSGSSPHSSFARRHSQAWKSGRFWEHPNGEDEFIETALACIVKLWTFAAV